MNIGIDIHNEKMYIAYSLEDGTIEFLCDDDGNVLYKIPSGHERSFFVNLRRQFESKFPQEEIQVLLVCDEDVTDVAFYEKALKDAGFEVEDHCERAILAAMAYKSMCYEASSVAVLLVEEKDTRLFILQKRKTGFSASHYMYNVEYSQTYVTNDMLADVKQIYDIVEFLSKDEKRYAIVVGEYAGEFIKKSNWNGYINKTDAEKRALAVVYGAAFCNNNIKYPTNMKFMTQLEMRIATLNKSMTLIGRAQEVEIGKEYKNSLKVETRDSSMMLSFWDDNTPVGETTIRWNQGTDVSTMIYDLEVVTKIIDKGCMTITVYVDFNKKSVLGLKKLKEKKAELEIMF